MKLKDRKDYRACRHRRVRRKVSGSSDRPRMAIMISDRHMYVQFIDDDKCVTLASVTTSGTDSLSNIKTASVLGKRAAETALKKGIKNAVADRGGHKYHGKVKAIVEAAIASGLTIGSGTKDSGTKDSRVKDPKEG